MILLPGRAPIPHRVMFKGLFSDRETQLRRLRFLAVGGGTALVQVAVINLLKRFMPELLAFSLSWVVSTATHYLANRFWALPSARHDTGKQFAEYLFTVAVSWVINTLAYVFCRKVVGLGIEWATLWAIPPSTVVVFLLLNFRVFRATNR
ncbi:MAG: GtrA family protein [Opitutaceae bacterium]|nr:GtrA family protein [Opitutaceae bacterium]